MRLRTQSTKVGSSSPACVPPVRISSDVIRTTPPISLSLTSIRITPSEKALTTHPVVSHHLPLRLTNHEPLRHHRGPRPKRECIPLSVSWESTDTDISKLFAKQAGSAFTPPHWTMGSSPLFDPNTAARRAGMAITGILLFCARCSSSAGAGVS